MKIYTAPIAGYTDYAYRQILKTFNPDLMYCEMINSNLWNVKNSNTEKLLRMSLDENTGVQVFGGDIELVYNTFVELHNRGYKHLLLNMGCPQPKILKNGAGANMLDRYAEVKYLLTSLRNDNIPISIKIRDSKYTNKYFELANELKLEYFCIHPRTKEEGFSGIAKWSIIEELSKIDREILLIGNGDIHSLNDYNKIKHLNIDGIMLARGLFKNPYLIKEIREGKLVSNKNNKDLCLKHFDLLFEDKGEHKAVIEINKFLKAYFPDKDLLAVLKEKNFEIKRDMIATI